MSSELSGFRIVEHLGRGAGSDIYLVADPHGGQLLALKRIVVRRARDRRFVRQAQNEFSVSRQLEHPYLRRGIAAHRIRRALRLREYHLVMEYVEGMTMQKQRPGEVGPAVDIFLKIARGLDSLHRVGYVHADMKPNNVLLGTNGTVKIIDFGQSCPVGHVKTRIQGTPEFIAPEQAYRLPLDARTDVFNLGATLYWVLTGRALPTVYARKRKSAVESEAPPPTAAECNAQVPESLSQLVTDCCHTDMRRRPQSMAHLIARLDEVRSDEWPAAQDPARRSKPDGAAVTRSDSAE